MNRGMGEWVSEGLAVVLRGWSSGWHLLLLLLVCNADRQTEGVLHWCDRQKQLRQPAWQKTS